MIFFLNACFSALKDLEGIVGVRSGELDNYSSEDHIDLLLSPIKVCKSIDGLHIGKEHVYQYYFVRELFILLSQHFSSVSSYSHPSISQYLADLLYHFDLQPILNVISEKLSLNLKQFGMKNASSFSQAIEDAAECSDDIFASKEDSSIQFDEFRKIIHIFSQIIKHFLLCSLDCIFVLDTYKYHQKHIEELYLNLCAVISCQLPSLPPLPHINHSLPLCSFLLDTSLNLYRCGYISSLSPHIMCVLWVNILREMDDKKIEQPLMNSFLKEYQVQSKRTPHSSKSKGIHSLNGSKIRDSTTSSSPSHSLPSSHRLFRFSFSHSLSLFTSLIVSMLLTHAHNTHIHTHPEPWAVVVGLSRGESDAVEREKKARQKKIKTQPKDFQDPSKHINPVLQSISIFGDSSKEGSESLASTSVLLPHSLAFTIGLDSFTQEQYLYSQKMSPAKKRSHPRPSHSLDRAPSPSSKWEDDIDAQEDDMCLSLQSVDEDSQCIVPSRSQRNNASSSSTSISSSRPSSIDRPMSDGKSSVKSADSSTVIAPSVKSGSDSPSTLASSIHTHTHTQASLTQVLKHYVVFLCEYTCIRMGGSMNQSHSNILHKRMSEGHDGHSIFFSVPSSPWIEWKREQEKKGNGMGAFNINSPTTASFLSFSSTPQVFLSSLLSSLILMAYSKKEPPQTPSSVVQSALGTGNSNYQVPCSRYHSQTFSGCSHSCLACHLQLALFCGFQGLCSPATSLNHTSHSVLSTSLSSSYPHPSSVCIDPLYSHALSAKKYEELRNFILSITPLSLIPGWMADSDASGLSKRKANGMVDQSTTRMTNPSIPHSKSLPSSPMKKRKSSPSRVRRHRSGRPRERAGDSWKLHSDQSRESISDWGDEESMKEIAEDIEHDEHVPSTNPNHNYDFSNPPSPTNSCLSEPGTKHWESHTEFGMYYRDTESSSPRCDHAHLHSKGDGTKLYDVTIGEYPFHPSPNLYIHSVSLCQSSLSLVPSSFSLLSFSDVFEFILLTILMCGREKGSDATMSIFHRRQALHTLIHTLSRLCYYVRPAKKKNRNVDKVSSSRKKATKSSRDKDKTVKSSGSHESTDLDKSTATSNIQSTIEPSTASPSISAPDTLSFSSLTFCCRLILYVLCAEIGKYHSLLRNATISEVQQKHSRHPSTHYSPLYGGITSTASSSNIHVANYLNPPPRSQNVSGRTSPTQAPIPHHIQRPSSNPLDSLPPLPTSVMIVLVEMLGVCEDRRNELRSEMKFKGIHSGDDLVGQSQIGSPSSLGKNESETNVDDERGGNIGSGRFVHLRPLPPVSQIHLGTVISQSLKQYKKQQDTLAHESSECVENECLRMAAKRRIATSIPNILFTLLTHSLALLSAPLHHTQYLDIVKDILKIESRIFNFFSPMHLMFRNATDICEKIVSRLISLVSVSPQAFWLPMTWKKKKRKKDLKSKKVGAQPETFENRMGVDVSHVEEDEKIFSIQMPPMSFKRDESLNPSGIFDEGISVTSSERKQEITLPPFPVDINRLDGEEIPLETSPEHASTTLNDKYASTNAISPSIPFRVSFSISSKQYDKPSIKAETFSNDKERIIHGRSESSKQLSHHLPGPISSITPRSSSVTDIMERKWDHIQGSSGESGERKDPKVSNPPDIIAPAINPSELDVPSHLEQAESVQISEINRDNPLDISSFLAPPQLSHMAFTPPLPSSNSKIPFHIFSSQTPMVLDKEKKEHSETGIVPRGSISEVFDSNSPKRLESQSVIHDSHNSVRRVLSFDDPNPSDSSSMYSINPLDSKSKISGPTHNPHQIQGINQKIPVAPHVDSTIIPSVFLPSQSPPQVSFAPSNYGLTSLEHPTKLYCPPQDCTAIPSTRKDSISSYQPLTNVPSNPGLGPSLFIQKSRKKRFKGNERQSSLKMRVKRRKHLSVSSSSA
ncbi:hypothetical protein ADUPG1_006876, partial [Aduncisulcus paluster]